LSRILLIDADMAIYQKKVSRRKRGIMPNLALMQIAGHHKQLGDEISLNIPNNPQIVYTSCVFRENRKSALGRTKYYPDAQVYVGGSGINYSWLPEDIQKHYPDYSLYDGKVCQKCAHLIYNCKCKGKPIPGNMFYSMGFTTRGCIRHCPFCIVYEKEGKIHKWQHIKDFYNPEYKVVILLDNNVYADRGWFFKNTDFLLEEGLKWNPIQGMDIRLIDDEIAERLAELKWYGDMHFAFDNMEDEQAVRRGVEILKNAGIDVRHVVQFYVLVGFDSTPEQDKYRCRLLKKLGTNAFVMPYIRNKWTNRIAWWANRKQIFWSCDIDDCNQKAHKGSKSRKKVTNNGHLL
jgi:hypothetical protein